LHQHRNTNNNNNNERCIARWIIFISVVMSNSNPNQCLLCYFMYVTRDFYKIVRPKYIQQWDDAWCHCRRAICSQDSWIWANCFWLTSVKDIHDIDNAGWTGYGSRIALTCRYSLNDRCISSLHCIDININYSV